MIMPNWIKNKIIFSKKSSIDEFIDKYCSLIDNSYQFDFNKVIKMPNELEVEFSSKSMDALLLYMTKICPNINYYGKKKDKIIISEWEFINKKLEDKVLLTKTFILSEEEVKNILFKYSKQEEQILKLGLAQVENIKKYGELNWYTWSINNWGTKWNSTNFEIKEGGKSITFDTAWDPAIPIIIEMSKQNPEIKFAFLYSDEDIGCKVGYILLSKGIIDYKGTFKNLSRDAYKLAFDLWECEKDYQWNDELNTYTIQIKNNV